MKLQRTIFVALIFFLMVSAVPVGALSVEVSGVLLRGFWFADGYLADDPRYMDWQVIANEKVLLYKHPDETSPVTGELPAGARARIQDIAFMAFPEAQVVTAGAAGKSVDGTIQVHPGTSLRLVCFMGDALAGFVGQELVLLEIEGLRLMPQVRPEWRRRMSGQNQWLYLIPLQGEAGWARFRGDGAQGGRRWQPQPRAVGGASNFNAIVFADKNPEFQRLPYVSAEKANPASSR